MSSNRRLTRAFKKAKKLPLTDASKYVMFSDCHRGDNSFADDFSRNRKLYLHALSHYKQEGFTYLELGDGDELWENSFQAIFDANKDVYLLLKEFHEANRLHFVWGNHDMAYRNPKAVERNLHYYRDTIDDKDKELMIGASFSEALVLEREDGRSIFLLHGHQADWFNYNFWRLSKFLVRYLWRPLQVLGVKDPTSPAQNFRELIKVERRLEKWIKANNNQMIITGHTHRPRFPGTTELPHFNDGSCVHPRCITGLEIEGGEITLIKWFLETNAQGIMKITRQVLEGPTSLTHYL
jgi:predicted phosphodiesterase